jgi:hypothetical protein
MVQLMMVRGELDYVDQVPRRLAYEKTHPNTEIVYISPHWQAITREDGDGLTVITRLSLGQLMDKLESLDEEMNTKDYLPPSRDGGQSSMP